MYKSIRMTELLVKIFVKDKEDVERQSVRTAYGVLASIVGVFCNLLLFLVKFFIGLFMNSISVMADAFNNLSDAASSVVSFAGVKLASRPADKEHPFGHGRYEYIAALIVAFLVLQVGGSCFQSSIGKVLHPEELKANWIMVAILGISILLKIWMGFFNKKLGKRIQSKVMEATAADAFGDVIITSATVISIIVGMVTGLKIDGYMGIVVSLLVLYAGFIIAKDTLEPLIGEAVTVKDYEKITNFVKKYPKIVGTHDLIVHNYGPSKLMATIHAEVGKDEDIEEIHEIIDKIERDAKEELDILLVIHMDPVEINNATVMKLKKIVNDEVIQLEANASIHDFRVVNGEEVINLIFDLVVPFEYSEKQKEEFLLKIINRIHEKDKRYQCVITLEHSFVAYS